MYLFSAFLHNQIDQQKSLLVGKNNGQDNFNDDDEIDYNFDQEDYTAEEMEQIEDAIAVFIFFISIAVLMFIGFFVFPPLFICLAHTGGDLDVCSFGMYK